MLTPRTVIALSMLLLAVGCSPAATFDVTIINQTERPLTVGIVKDGGPLERNLLGPEQLAIDSALESLPPWGHVIPPGKTMDSGKVTGAFPRGATAYLRVYRGRHDNAHLVAISSPSPDRLDVLLFPGYTELVIREDEKGLVANRLRQAAR
jgi:hypothetical protein